MRINNELNYFDIICDAEGRNRKLMAVLGLIPPSQFNSKNSKMLVQHHREITVKS
jgi:hypothetical protein